MKKLVILIMFLLIPCFADALPCNVSLSIDAKSLESGKIEFYNRLNNKSFNYIIEYWIEDIDGNIIKRKTNTSNQNKKTFTPKNTDNGIIIKSRIAKIDCDDVNLDDNFAEKKFYTLTNVNLTHKSVKISFEINKDFEKLADLSKKLNLNSKTRSNYTPTINPSSTKQQKYSQNPEENKLRPVIPYFLIALTTLISVVLVWRR